MGGGPTVIETTLFLSKVQCLWAPVAFHLNAEADNLQRGGERADVQEQWGSRVPGHSVRMEMGPVWVAALTAGGDRGLQLRVPSSWHLLEACHEEWLQSSFPLEVPSLP